MDARCRISLLGELRIEQNDRVITRFRSRKFGLLLAYLAFYLHRSHPRDELIELLWPECDPDAGRNRLSTALWSLRRQLEPPGIPAGSVIVADRATVRLQSRSATTDVWEFENSLQAAARSGSPAERARMLEKAVDLYRGPLLQEFYEEWTLPERHRLAEAYVQALRALAADREQAGDLLRAIDWARRAASADPLREELHCDLMRLHAAAGQPAAALRQYRLLERVLKRELGTAPSPAVCRLAREIAAGSQDSGRVAPILPPLPDAAPTPECDAKGAEAPPPPTPDAATLPLQLTRFFGREEEIRRLVDLLSPVDSRWLMVDGSGSPSTINHQPSTRLLTLTGPGGSGKTRLALEVAERLLESYAGAVRFVPLADLTDAELLPAAVLAALRVPQLPAGAPFDQVVRTLSRQPALLVLDNFEQLVEDGAARVGKLLERLPRLTCLVTSRRSLGLSAEREWPVGPLAVPVDGRWSMGERLDPRSTPPAPRVPDHQPSTLATCASVQLFVDRAQAVRPDFQVTPNNAAAVAELCGRLEGIPLALELAAARAQVLTPTQMLEQLGRRFDFLVGRKRDVPGRHRSLRAAIDWSYRLLSPELQSFLRRLSVFRGGWTLEAAAAVSSQQSAVSGGAAPGTLPPSAFILHPLEALRSASLILAEETSGEMRFRMLETLREYAAEQLSAEEEQDARRRHLDYFRRVVDPSAFLSPADPRRYDLLEQEHDNIRAALDGCAAPGGDLSAAVELAIRLSGFWLVRSHLAEGRARLESLLAAPEAAPTPSRAPLLVKAALLAREQGDHAAARRHAEEGIALCRTLDDQVLLAFGLNELGAVLRAQDDPDAARAPLEESLHIFRALDHQDGLIVVSVSLSLMAHRQGDSAAARAHLSERMALQREMGDPRGVAHSLLLLAHIATADAEYEQARFWCEEALSLYRSLDDQRGSVGVLNCLARVAWKQGKPPLARTHLAESLALCRKLENRRTLAYTLDGAASLAAAGGQAERAARLLGAAEALLEKVDAGRQPLERAVSEEAAVAARTVLGEKRFAALHTEGRAMEMEEAIRYALAEK